MQTWDFNLFSVREKWEWYRRLCQWKSFITSSNSKIRKTISSSSITKRISSTNISTEWIFISN